MMSIFSKIKSLFKRPEPEVLSEDPCIVQRSVDGQYAIRKRDYNGDTWYLKVRVVDKTSNDNGVVTINPARYEWESGRYKHAYDCDDYWCIWTSDLQGLLKIINYKETKVEGVSE